MVLNHGKSINVAISVTNCNTAAEVRDSKDDARVR